MGANAQHRPQTPGHRLEMFLTLAAAFIDAADTLGSTRMLPRGQPGSVTYREDVWKGLFKIMLLRKFFAEQDSVQIPKVVTALRECNRELRFANVERIADDIQAAWESRDVRDILNDLRSVIPGDSGRDPLETILYGWLIHADADKFDVLKGLDQRAWFIAQLVAGATLERVVRYAHFGVGSCFDAETQQLHE
ncbi:hypothetical protein [Sinomonas atrocyanea]|uniref:hypothetical protein n=1 Tax=Sinomonas atrocyanea TaxID=37927 RepID=UPI002854B5A3|nr:hypothetical protein [Sinomonas atrocyanea]MDR6623041.1 hypothetical protein [Sinomonas atrocyanea]